MQAKCILVSLSVSSEAEMVGCAQLRTAAQNYKSLLVFFSSRCLGCYLLFTTVSELLFDGSFLLKVSVRHAAVMTTKLL